MRQSQEALELHSCIIQQSGGSTLESAIAQPLMTFDGVDLYPTLVEKAAALSFSIISNHPFIDGNKRVGHAVMETFLILNGCEINSSVTEQEKIILRLAAGQCERAEFVEWLRDHVVQVK